MSLSFSYDDYNNDIDDHDDNVATVNIYHALTMFQQCATDL